MQDLHSKCEWVVHIYLYVCIYVCKHVCNCGTIASYWFGSKRSPIEMYAENGRRNCKSLPSVCVCEVKWVLLLNIYEMYAFLETYF